MQPLQNKVIVERIEKELTTSSGIILQSGEGPDFAKVIAIGPDVKEVSVDDTILLDWNKAVKSGDIYVVTENNIVFVVEEE